MGTDMNQQTKNRIGWILIGAGFVGGLAFGTRAGDILQAIVFKSKKH